MFNTPWKKNAFVLMILLKSGKLKYCYQIKAQQVTVNEEPKVF